MSLPEAVYQNRFDDEGRLMSWDTHSVHELMGTATTAQSIRTTERALEASGLIPSVIKHDDLKDEFGRAPKSLVADSLEAEARKKRWQSLVIQAHSDDKAGMVLFANDGRMGRRWLYLEADFDDAALLAALAALVGSKHAIVWPHGPIAVRFRALVRRELTHDIVLGQAKVRIGTVAYHGEAMYEMADQKPLPTGSTDKLSHLDRLEAESMFIIREVVSQSENPVMLYSIGKDSSVMLHLARKAFYPSTPPFPLMHVDTRWKFQAMYEFRDRIAAEMGMDLIVHINPEGVEKDINPFDHGSVIHTDVMKTEGLKQALDMHRFDVAFGGARRDEEKSRAKERVFSFRTRTHQWEPKNQRPELWNLYNGFKNRGESIRVFPLSNWTELDIWQYIYREQIPIVPLYYAAERPVVERDGMLIMVDDDRMRMLGNEEIKIKRVRFRTLGCYPLTGAVESDADDLASIVLELLESRTSERQGRAIDSDSSASMEKKKREGYF